jgi:hypothetical protein
MTRLSGTMVSRQSVVTTIAQVFSDRLGIRINPSMIRLQGTRIGFSCSPTITHVIYARKQELLDALHARLPQGVQYYL